ncbi:MAG: sigma-70 family RNA polymerase sigma factor [Myxococcales bacterium]
MENRALMIEKYGPYVRSLANTVRKQFNSRLDIEDLVAYGNIGLFEAAERFDPKVGSNFLTFAHYRIKGAIFDGLRKMGTLKGPDQRAAYISDRANAYLSAQSSADSGGRVRSFADDVRDVSDAVSSLAAIFATSLEGMEHLQLKDESLSPEDRLELRELKTRVRVAIETVLQENERNLLIGYYYEGKTLEEAGQAIGQSKSWASRLHARAIDKIKKVLEEEIDGPTKPASGTRPAARPTTPPTGRPAATQSSEGPRPAATPRTVTR